MGEEGGEVAKLGGGGGEAVEEEEGGEGGGAGGEVVDVYGVWKSYVVVGWDVGHFGEGKGGFWALGCI